MSRTVPAVYEKGVLRPLEPLHLHDNQRVTVTVRDSNEDIIDHELLEELERMEIPDVSLTEVQQRLSKISGSLGDDIMSDREERF
jgi:predicted DNA-binding antitoxin AbrB/MazE fold protein